MNEKKSLTERLGGTTNDQVLAEYENIDAENLSYDFFKNLTSLSILALGGVLTLSEKVFGDTIENWQMFVAAGLFALSGLVALQCQSDIVQVSRGKKAPTTWLRWGHRIAPGLLGGGVGGFLVMLGGAMG